MQLIDSVVHESRPLIQRDEKVEEEEETERFMQKIIFKWFDGKYL